MILQVKKKDVSDCVDVIKKSFRTVADKYGFSEKNAPRYTPFYVSAEKLEERLDRNRPMFAYFTEPGNKLVGYYSLKLLKNGDCDLRNLCVLPEYRQQGVGTALFRHAVNTAKQGGCKRMKLSIVNEDTEVRRWYEKLGAVHVGTQKYDFFPFTCGYMEVDLTKMNSRSASGSNVRKVR